MLCTVFVGTVSFATPVIQSEMQERRYYSNRKAIKQTPRYFLKRRGESGILLKMKKATKKFLTASEYFEKRFGGKVYKLALSSSDTCPNRDGRVGVGGCTFCAEGSGGFAERGESATEMIERAKVRVSAKIKKGDN